MSMLASMSSPKSSFSKQRVEEKQDRLTVLLHQVRQKSETGWKVIKEASDSGKLAAIVFEPLKGSHGNYWPFGKRITLSSCSSDADLFSTLVHEARHACQSPDRQLHPDSFSRLMRVRAAEADAMAFECAAAYEAHDDTWRCFKKAHTEIAKAYEYQMIAGKPEKTAITEAFKAWFDDKEYASLYDAQTLKDPFVTSSSFSEKQTSAEILGQYCKFGNENYMAGDMDFLVSERALFLTADNFKTCQDMHKEAEQKYSSGTKDRSYEQFDILYPDGSTFGKTERKFVEVLTGCEATAKVLEELDADKKVRLSLDKALPFEKAGQKKLAELMDKLYGKEPHVVLSDTIQSVLIRNRAFDAGKTAVEAAYCHTVKGEVWQAFTRQHPAVAVAYAKDAGDGKKALKKAFEAFYKEENSVEKADAKTIAAVGMICTHMEGEQAFTKPFAGVETKVAAFADPAFLTSFEAQTVSEKTMKKLQSVLNESGQKDSSVDNFQVRMETGKIISAKNDRSLTAKLSNWLGVGR